MAGELILDIEKRFSTGAELSARLQATLGGGTTLVLFGPSGAGKTTVIRCIAGLERPDRGHIVWGGATWFHGGDGRFVPTQERRIGLVGQEPALFPHLSVRANVEYGVRDRPAAMKSARTDEMLSLLEIEDLAQRLPRELSGGQAQRVALARALAPNPRLLLLDEPLGALDTPARHRLRGRLRALIERTGVSAVLVTHDRTEALALGDDIAVLAGGRIRQVGPVLDVFRRPADLVVAESVGVESVIAATVGRVEDGLVDLRVGDATLRAVAGDLDPGREQVFACVRAEDVMLQRDAASGASARNHLTGRIVGIDAEGPVDRVTMDCGFPLVALITRQARDEMALHPGGTVVAVIKATAIHLV